MPAALRGADADPFGLSTQNCVDVISIPESPILANLSGDSFGQGEIPSVPKAPKVPKENFDLKLAPPETQKGPHQPPIRFQGVPYRGTPARRLSRWGPVVSHTNRLTSCCTFTGVGFSSAHYQDTNIRDPPPKTRKKGGGHPNPHPMYVCT